MSRTKSQTAEDDFGSDNASVTAASPSAGNSSSNLTRRQASALGASTSVVRSMLLQPLYLWYRTPLKLFRPLRVDYLATARALLPAEELNKRVSFASTTVGTLFHAIKQRGWSFLPRYVIQPMLANWAVGFTLFTTYTAALPVDYARYSASQSAYLTTSVAKPESLLSPIAAGALAGLAQSAVATPLDSLRVRFEVEDMLSGRYRSWFGFVRDKVAEDGIARLYRGFAITVVKDIVGFAAFFGLFEITKIELLDLYRNLHMEARRLRSRHLGEDGEVAVRPADAGAQKLTRKEVVELRRRATRPSREEQRRSQEGAEAKSDVLEAIGNSIRAPMVVLPSLLLPPYLGQASCVLIAGAVAALAYQAVDYPLEQLRNYVYTELADTELISVIQKRAHAGSVPVEWRPYRHIWMGLKRHAAKELGANPDHFWTPIRYLYSGWWGVAVRSVPAASIGLVFYEVIKQWLQSDDLQLLAPP